MKQRTLKEWNARGRCVKKGSKAVGFKKSGVALFTKAQTEKRVMRSYDGSTNYNQGSYYFGGDDPDQMDYDFGLCGQI